MYISDMEQSRVGSRFVDYSAFHRLLDVRSSKRNFIFDWKVQQYAVELIYM